MAEEKLYIIHQGDGLKSHLSTDRKGNIALCGLKIPRVNKSVQQFNPGPFGFGNLFMTDLYCKKCLKQVGIHAE